MGIVATLRLPVQPDKVEQLKAFLKADLPDTRQFEGCQAVSVYQDEDVPASIVVWGTWDSRGHFEKYLAWRTARGDQEALGGNAGGATGSQLPGPRRSLRTCGSR